MTAIKWKLLANASPVKADVVIGIPDSGLAAALGYSMESKIPYGIGFVKNKYLNESSIGQTDEERESSLEMKLNVIKSVIENKNACIVTIPPQ